MERRIAPSRADGEAINRAANAAKARCFRQCRLAAVVGAVADNDEPAQQAIALMAVVDFCQHRAEFSSLAFRLGVVRQLVPIRIELLRELVEVNCRLLVVAHLIENWAAFIEHFAHDFPAGEIGRVLDRHAFGRVDDNDQGRRQLRNLGDGRRWPQRQDDREEQGEQSEADKRCDPSRRTGGRARVGGNRQEDEQCRHAEEDAVPDRVGLGHRPPRGIRHDVPNAIGLHRWASSIGRRGQDALERSSSSSKTAAYVLSSGTRTYRSSVRKRAKSGSSSPTATG